jgi:hypothetical protein
MHLPEKGLAAPLELRLGAAVKLGGKPWNALPEGLKPRPADEAEKGRGPSRFFENFYVLLSAEIALWGPVRDAIGIDGFLRQVEERAGRTTAVSFRVGAEAEILPGWIRVRAGSYWEPSRSEHYAGRLHLTAGLELRLFSFTFLGDHTLNTSFALDVAERYSNVSLSVGFWH